jgi:psiF repeat-containing protein
MPRTVASASVFVIAIGLAFPAFAQSPSGPGPSSMQLAPNMSPEQSAEKYAAKRTDCSKQSKAQKLTGSKRRAFLKDCMKK